MPEVIENPVPVTAAEFTESDSVPLEVSVMARVSDEPSVTVPNARVEVLRVIFGAGGRVPVPASETFAVPPVVELLWIVSWPVSATAVVGANLI